MPFDYLDEFSSDFLVIGGLYDGQQGLLDAAHFHPSFCEADLTIKVLRRHVYSMLDRDDVESRKVLQVQDSLQVLGLFQHGSTFQGEIEDTNGVRACFAGDESRS